MCPFHNPFSKNKNLEQNSGGAFLSLLSNEEKIKVNNFTPILYQSIIKEKQGQKVSIIMEDASDLAILRKLNVTELEQLSLSVEACQKGDRLANSNITEAGVNYKKAAEINPYNDLALMSYGVCFARKGNLQEGIKWVEKAVQVNPRNERAKRNLEAMKRDLGSR